MWGVRKERSTVERAIMCGESRLRRKRGRKREINEEKIKEKEREDKELKEKYANEEKISRDKGRVVTVEEYRKNKNNNGYSTDAVWDDKSFTAVDEIKQWGKLGEYIYKMIGEDIKLVGKESAEKLMELCKKYQDIWEAPKMPMKTEVKHKIELTDLTTKLAQKHYKIGPKEEEIMRELVKEWLRTGIIEEIKHSEYRAPAILVPKPDGTMRMVIDFRKLNKLTRKNKYPMDDTDAVMMRLKGSRWFSKFDLSNGFYQIQVEEESRKFTTFVTRDGMYQFVRMPMGLTNSPATFACAMNDCLGDLSIKGNNMECYVDDILVHSETFDDHVSHLAILFQRLRERDIKLKPSKCLMARRELIFLGHKISEKGIEPDPGKVVAVKSWEAPKNPKKLHTFLGLTGYYRKFIRGYASIAACLFDLIKPKAVWKWGDEEQRAFERLRGALCDMPIVSAPDWNKTFILQTDAATKAGIGCVLIQREEVLMPDGTKKKIERVIAYASKKLTDAEKRWPVREIEAYAIVWGITHFHLYMSQAPFEVETDHQSLKWLFTWDKPGRLNRWALRLQEYDFKITYRKGSLNGNADALSRKDEDDSVRDRRKEKNSARVGAVAKDRSDVEVANLNNIREAQRTDKDSQDIIKYMRKDLSGCENASEWSKVEKMRGEFVLLGEGNEATLYKITHDCGGEPSLRLVIPECWRDPLVTYYHASPTGGHLGFDKIYPIMKQQFYWGGMTKDIKKMTKGCVACVCSRTSARERSGLLQVRDDVGYPGEAVSVDTLGPFIKSAAGNMYVATFVDHFTLKVDIEPLVDKRAETMAVALYKYTARNGVPKKIVTDRGSEFVNALMESFTKLMGIKHNKTTAHHHQAMGIVERVHRVFRDGLRAYLDERTKEMNWDIILFGLMSAMNGTHKRKLGCSPYYAHHGRNMVTAWDIGIGEEQLEARSDFTANLVRTMVDCYKTIKLGIAKEGGRSKKAYDERQKGVQFSPNEEVAVYFPVIGKTRRQWRSGFRVVKMTSDVNVLVEHTESGKQHEVHVKRIARVTWGEEYDKKKNYKGKEPEEWVHADKNISGIKNEDIKIDDIIIFAYRLSGDMRAEYYVGRLMEEENGQYHVHFMKPVKGKRPGAKWNWVYVDKKDGKEVHTNKTRYKYSIFDAWITKQEILITGIKLNKKDMLNPKTEEEAARRVAKYKAA